jgi:hypothetical protein
MSNIQHYGSNGSISNFYKSKTVSNWHKSICIKFKSVAFGAIYKENSTSKDNTSTYELNKLELKFRQKRTAFKVKGGYHK